MRRLHLQLNYHISGVAHDRDHEFIVRVIRDHLDIARFKPSCWQRANTRRKSNNIASTGDENSMRLRLHCLLSAKLPIVFVTTSIYWFFYHWILLSTLLVSVSNSHIKHNIEREDSFNCFWQTIKFTQVEIYWKKSKVQFFLEVYKISTFFVKTRKIFSDLFLNQNLYRVSLHFLKYHSYPEKNIK